MRTLKTTLPVTVVALLVAALFCSSAQAQVVGTLTGVPTSVASNQTTATFTTSASVYVAKSGGVAFWLQVASPTAAMGSSSNVVWGFDLSPDGTTWSGSSGIWPVYSVTNTLNGTTNTVAYRNFTEEELANASFVRLSSIASGSTNYLTNIVVKYSILSRNQ